MGANVLVQRCVHQGLENLFQRVLAKDKNGYPFLALVFPACERELYAVAIRVASIDVFVEASFADMFAEVDSAHEQSYHTMRIPFLAESPL